MLLYMAVSITVLATGEIREVENGLMSQDHCAAWAQRLGSLPVPELDPVSRRPITSRSFVCRPVEGSEGNTSAP